MASHTDLGTKGEKLAIEFLQNKGYRILETNYRFQKAEIDIICQNSQFVVAVEVKTRSTNNFGDPQGFLKPKQIARVVKAMDAFVVKRNLEQEVRFDVIGIVMKGQSPEIEHLENAFFHF